MKSISSTLTIEKNRIATENPWLVLLDIALTDGQTVFNLVSNTEDIYVPEPAGEVSFARAGVAYQQDGTQVAAGIPRFEAGKHGQALMVEEAATNYQPYSDLSNNTNNTVGGSSTTKMNFTVNGVTMAGVRIIQEANTGNFTNLGGTAFSSFPASASTLIMSAYVKCSGASMGFKCQFLAVVGGTTYYLSTDGLSWTTTPSETTRLFEGTMPTADFARVTRVFPALPAGALTTFQLTTVYRNNPSQTLDICGLQIEAKAYATSYIPTTSAAVIRNAEVCTIPTAGVLSATEGTIECWAFVDTSNGLGSLARGGGIFCLNYGNDQQIALYHDNGGSYPIFKATTKGVSTASTATKSDTAYSGWTHFAVTWSASSLVLYINGVAANTVASPNLPSSISGNAYIGSLNSSSQCGTLVDDLRISNRARTADEIAATYASSAPVPYDADTTAIMRFDGSLSWAKPKCYTACPLDIVPPKESAKGEIPTVTLRVGNVTRVIQGYLEALNGAIGSTVTLRVMNAAFLDENYADLEMTFDVLSASCTAQWVTFTLGAPSPLQRRFPLHRFIAASCNWQFKSAECAYAGADTTCNRTLAACQAKGNSRRFGGFPGLVGGGLRLA